MRVLVTGASGFIGTNLMASLGADCSSVLNVDAASPLCAAQEPYRVPGNILDPVRLQAIFRAYAPTHVLHLAARTDCDERATLDDYRVNTDGTRNVLAAVAATPSVQRLIVTSTQFVCRPGHWPQGDEDYNPHTVYGQSKVVAERLTRRADLGCTWTIVRPTTIWGPWLLRHRDQFFPVLRRGLYVHPGRKPCLRSWGYVGNVVHQMRKILEAPAALVHGKVFYLGDPPRSLLDWVNACSVRLRGKPVLVAPRGVVLLLGLLGDAAGLVGVRFPISTSRYRSMTEDYLVPIQPTLDVAGQSPFSLEQGVEEVVRWLEQCVAERVTTNTARVRGTSDVCPAVEDDLASRSHRGRTLAASETGVLASRGVLPREGQR